MQLIDTLNCACGGKTEILGDAEAAASYETMNVQFSHKPRPGQATENQLHATIEALTKDKAELVAAAAELEGTVRDWLNGHGELKSQDLWRIREFLPADTGITNHSAPGSSE